jgi:hypothetical protein
MKSDKAFLSVLFLPGYLSPIGNLTRLKKYQLRTYQHCTSTLNFLFAIFQGRNSYQYFSKEEIAAQKVANGSEQKLSKWQQSDSDPSRRGPKDEHSLPPESRSYLIPSAFASPDITCTNSRGIKNFLIMSKYKSVHLILKIL